MAATTGATGACFDVSTIAAAESPADGVMASGATGGAAAADATMANAAALTGGPSSLLFTGAGIPLDDAATGGLLSARRTPDLPAATLWGGLAPAAGFAAGARGAGACARWEGVFWGGEVAGAEDVADGWFGCDGLAADGGTRAIVGCGAAVCDVAAAAGGVHPGGAVTSTKLPHFGHSMISPTTSALRTAIRAWQVTQETEKSALSTVPP